MLEFGGSEEFGPLVWVVCAEDPEVSFNFLIGSFGLPISLGMVSGGEAVVVFEDSSEFSGKGRCELWAMVRDEGIMESEVFEHVVKKSWAIPFVSIVFEQGVSITPFVRLWSTTTIRESCPCERGKSVIRLTESCLKGRVEEDLMGKSGGITGCVRALFCWQMAQPATKLLTNTESPSHQKSRSTIALVRKHPRWSKRGEEWMEWSRDDRVGGGTYIRPL